MNSLLSKNHATRGSRTADRSLPMEERHRSRGNRAGMFHQLQIRLGRNTHWIGRLGLFGSIGWAIIVPTLLGMSIGLWVDTLYPGDFAWTSLLLPLGLFLGCVNAGYWFQQDFTPKD